MESSSPSPSPSSSLSSRLQYWLVEHPVAREFEWKKGITFGSSPLFLSLTVFTYLSLTFFLSHFKFRSLSLPSSSPLLRLISTVHNLFFLSLSLIMAGGKSTAVVPPRLSSRGGGSDVLRVVEHGAVSVPHRAGDQRQRAHANEEEKEKGARGYGVGVLIVFSISLCSPSSSIFIPRIMGMGMGMAKRINGCDFF
ncbi:hypothetical protein RJ641_013128 [Dillenia turbinata]|uniref:Uncharacterized protein n=1 Tax=Dillenia turbinata TaxID=194707 RepID=A0AAN8ZL53_9MAGN